MIKIIRKRPSEYIWSHGTQRTKQSCMDFIMHGRVWASVGRKGVGCCLTGFLTRDRDEYIYAYTLEKHRHKSKLTGRKNKDGKPQKKIVTAGHWVYRVYRFALRDVVAFKQHERHFDITLKAA